MYLNKLILCIVFPLVTINAYKNHKEHWRRIITNCQCETKQHSFALRLSGELWVICWDGEITLDIFHKLYPWQKLITATRAPLAAATNARNVCYSQIKATLIPARYIFHLCRHSSISSVIRLCALHFSSVPPSPVPRSVMDRPGYPQKGDI